MSDRLYPCCEHCAEDSIHDVPVNGHEITCNAAGPCSTRPHDVWAQLEDLRAELTETRARLAENVALLRQATIGGQ